MFKLALGILLALASVSWGQDVAPGSDLDLRLMSLEKMIYEMRQGRPTLTSLPKFNQGIKFSDGTTQTSAGATLGGNNAFTGQNTYSSTQTFNGALITNGVFYPQSFTVYGDQGVGFSTKTPILVWAKSVDGIAQSSSCFMSMKMSADTLLGTAVATSTTDANAPGVNVVLFDDGNGGLTCTPSNWCRFVIAGPCIARTGTSVNPGDKLATSTTRCQAAASTAGQASGHAISNDFGLSSWYWANP